MSICPYLPPGMGPNGVIRGHLIIPCHLIMPYILGRFHKTTGSPVLPKPGNHGLDIGNSSPKGPTIQVSEILFHVPRYIISYIEVPVIIYPVILHLWIIYPIYPVISFSQIYG